MVSIRIPCYNQPQLLDYCLSSIQAQNYKDYQVLLIDDCSTVEYFGVIEKYSDLRIKYIRNEQNKGAIANMLYALNVEDDCDYRIVFHEDDILQPNYLEVTVKALEESNKGFACTYISFFDHHNTFVPLIIDADKRIKINTEAEFIKFILQGAPLGFGTILYKKGLAKSAHFNLNQFDVMGDRPMLINLLSNTGAVIIPYPLVAVYSHWDGDGRWKTLKYAHVFNLYRFYRSFLDKKNIQLSIIEFTQGIIDGFKLVGKSNLLIKAWYYLKSYFHQIMSLKYSLLYNNRIRSFVNKIKS